MYRHVLRRYAAGIKELLSLHRLVDEFFEQVHINGTGVSLHRLSGVLLTLVLSQQGRGPGKGGIDSH